MTADSFWAICMTHFKQSMWDSNWLVLNMLLMGCEEKPMIYTHRLICVFVETILRCEKKWALHGKAVFKIFKCSMFLLTTHNGDSKQSQLGVAQVCSISAILSLGSIGWVPCIFDEQHTFNSESNDGLDFPQHVNSCKRQLRCLMMHRGIAAKCLSHLYWCLGAAPPVRSFCWPPTLQTA